MYVFFLSAFILKKSIRVPTRIFHRNLLSRLLGATFVILKNFNFLMYVSRSGGLGGRKTCSLWSKGKKKR